MPMPAFDMEPGSTSPPDGNPAPPSPDDAVVGTPPPGAETAPAKPPNGGTVPGKPPTASLISITGKAKPAPSKAGDLTRLFALAHRQGPSEPVEPLPAAGPAPIPAAPAVLDSLPEPQPMPVWRPIAEVSPELETAPDLPPVEQIGFVEPPMASEPAADVWVEPTPAAEPLALSLIVADDVAADTAKRLPGVLAPADDDSVPLELSEPAPDVVEPAIPTPAVPIEPATPPPPALSRIPERASPTAPAPAKFVELADYWRSLRSGDDHPAAESIDHDLVSKRWPGSLLIAYTPASQDPRGEPRPGRVTRLGTACAETQNAVDAGSHSTEWMLEVARAALINDEPVEEQQRLATLRGDASFRIVALPLGPPKGLATAVLCTLLPSSGAPRFGKRRVWL
jgi:hypothetical protein